MLEGLYYTEPQKRTVSELLTRKPSEAFCGLGKPYIKLEFENNDELLEYQRRAAFAIDNENRPELEWDEEKQIFKTENLNGLNAPGDTYIITDTRLRGKKDLSELKTLQKFNIKQFDETENGNADSGVILVDIKKINKDTARFQNRENAESSESVNRILAAVKNNAFNWAAFDPIVVWRDPSNGKLFVLSGHSRTRAFEILSEQGATVDGKNFAKIPVKFFNGTEQEAIDFALNSNTLSTKETDVERANYYRRLIGTMPEYKLKELAENNEGKNANRIIAYAHLRPNSYTLDALKRLQNSSTENAEIVKTVADWIGRLMILYPNLTPEHDKEIFNWLVIEGHYGIGAGKVNNYQKLLDVIRIAIFNLNNDYSKKLNLSNTAGGSDGLKNFNAQLKALQNELKAAQKELNDKRKIYLNRQKLDPTITSEQIKNALQKYNDNILLLQRQILDLNSRKNQFTDGDKRQTSLFGIDFTTFLFENSEPFVTKNLNIWNINKEFPDVIKDKNGDFIFVVKTPIKCIYLRDKQFEKLKNKGREQYFGLIKPTLTDPLIILEDNNADIYVKTFIKPTGEKIICFCSVCDNTSDFVTSNHEKREKQILNKIKAGAVKYIKNISHVDYGINGTTHAAPLYIVDFPLFDCKNKIKKNNNKKNLGAISASANVWNTTKLNYNGFKPTYEQLNDYSKFFGNAENLDRLSGYGLSDTLAQICETVKNNYRDCAFIAAHLKANTAAQSCFNLWHWLHENVKYNYDEKGKEQLRTPRRVWHDRHMGVDCDCLSIFAYCTLVCMGYKPQFEIAKFNGKPQFSHIYVVCNDVVLDRVWPTFNERAPFITETKNFSVHINNSNNLAGLF